MWNSKFESKSSVPKAINGEICKQKIANLFADYFAESCTANSASKSTELLNEYEHLKQSVSSNCKQSDMTFSTELVDHVIRDLKLGKAAGADSITAEHLTHAHPIVVTLLTSIFNIMLHYEYVPNDFGVGLTFPVPKGPQSNSTPTVENYRGITISPIISKVFEYCLLNRYHNLLNCSNRQFGFKKNSSVSHAVFSLRKTIEYFIEKDSTVNICTLDMAKAFDKMNWYSLFSKLIKRNCPLKFVNVLECWYSKSNTTVKWGDCLSRSVQLLAGLRQGGILSPFLFAIYVDDILTKLQDSGLGCHIKYVCFNSYMYADDLLLLSISVCDLQKMVNLCNDELVSIDMRINTGKSACLRIGPPFNKFVSNITINNCCIQWINEIKYLGIYVMSAKNFVINNHAAKVKFFRSVNGILSKISYNQNTDAALSLISSFALPTLTFGLEACNLTRAQADRLAYPFNSVFMKIFSSFNKDVIALCQFYTGFLPLQNMLDVKVFNFLNNLSNAKDKSCPASILHNWFGARESNRIADKYNICVTDSKYIRSRKVWAFFEGTVL